MKKLLIVCLIFILGASMKSYGQDEIPAHILEKITYPVLDFHPFIGVMPVDNPELLYNPNLDYKVVLDLYGKVKDSTAIHTSFLEMGRTYNLGRANKIPKEKLKVVGVIHGGMVQAILTDEEYQKKYGIPNPNLSIIEKLKEQGIEIYVCGQSMAFLNIPPNKITNSVKLVTSAKFAFVTFDQMGYSFLDISAD